MDAGANEADKSEQVERWVSSFARAKTLTWAYAVVWPRAWESPLRRLARAARSCH
jgi:hypothetical protein